jgi:hypothetical protein
MSGRVAVALFNQDTNDTARHRSFKRDGSVGVGMTAAGAERARVVNAVRDSLRAKMD